MEVLIYQRFAFPLFTELINNGATFFYTRIVSLQRDDEARSPRQQVNLRLYFRHFLGRPNLLE
jgi:hypothetical protein